VHERFRQTDERMTTYSERSLTKSGQYFPPHLSHVAALL